MRYKALLSIGLGLGLALGSGVTLADDQPVTDTLTKPLGGTDASKSGDKSKPSTKAKADDGSQKASFGALDVNTDRKLSRSEVKANASLSADFDKLDADRNGELSDGEFAKFESGPSKDDDSKAEEKGKEGKEKVKKNSREAERQFDDATDTK